MAGSAVRVPSAELKMIQQWAEERNLTPGSLIAEWAHEYQQKLFWDRARESVARLKADTAAWKEMQEEQRTYDNALMDGLEEEVGKDSPSG